jgi:hypothetical protein
MYNMHIQCTCSEYVFIWFHTYVRTGAESYGYSTYKKGIFTFCLPKTVAPNLF